MNTINTTKLEKLIGQDIAYNQYVYHIKEVEKQAESVVLYTDSKPIILHSDAQVQFFLDDIQPVQLPAKKNGNQHPAQPQIIGADVLHQLRNVLIENIQRVKDDKDYIPQANAVAKQVNTLIQLTHMEITARRAIHKGDI